jgi:hypothetical protein
MAEAFFPYLLRIKNFQVIRTLTGFTSNTYTVVMILAIEMCGMNRRVTAGNIIYYLYIIGELMTVGFAYFFRDYDSLMITYTVVLSIFIFYFWYAFKSSKTLICYMI